MVITIYLCSVTDKSESIYNYCLISSCVINLHSKKHQNRIFIVFNGPVEKYMVLMATTDNSTSLCDDSAFSKTSRAESTQTHQT